MEPAMSYHPKGKHVTIDQNAPEALGICDFSGFVFKRKDLYRQMEWRGEALVWTGFLVGKPYLFTPNEQGRAPILPPDPVPVAYPRLPQPEQQTWTNNQFTTWAETTDYTWTFSDNFDDGIIAPPETTRLQNLQNFNWGTGF